MKKTSFLLVVFLFTINISNAQWTTNPDGSISTTSSVVLPKINNQYIGFGVNGQSQSFAAGTTVLGGSNNSGYANTAVGNNVLNANNFSGFQNVGLGQNVLSSCTTALGNVGIGSEVLFHHLIGRLGYAITRLILSH